MFSCARALPPVLYTCAFASHIFCFAPRPCYPSACCCTYVCIQNVLTCSFLCPLSAPTPPCALLSPPLAYFHFMVDGRLEEQLAKATLVTENTRGSRAHGSKRGRSHSPSPEPWGQSNRRYANQPARRGKRSPSAARQPRHNSPLRDNKQRRTAKSTTDSQQSFQTGAAGNGALSACTICLGRYPHDIFNCKLCTLWDGSPARCKKNSQGRLVNPAGNILCSDWQRPNSCSSTTHDSRHECSGCGKPAHGAQNCPRAQKA